MEKSMQFWMPTRPFSVIDAINRMAAATGSMRFAAAASSANYNGHRVTVSFNTYRQYWVADYFWAGRVVLSRGSSEIQPALDAALREYNRGALGAEVIVDARNEAEAEACIKAGLVPYSEAARAAHDATWRTDLHNEVNDAMELERQVGIPAVGFLANSATMDEYKGKVDAFEAERIARRNR
jgi:hypothetical protein